MAPLPPLPDDPSEPLDCVCFTLIIDDIVLPDGRTVMAQLGGSGAQSLFAFQLVNGQRTRVGLAAGVGPDLPSSCQAWLESIGVDLSGLVRYKRPTPRAWQVFEADGRRTQVCGGMRICGTGVLGMRLGRACLEHARLGRPPRVWSQRQAATCLRHAHLCMARCLLRQPSCSQRSHQAPLVK
mmetsp:Transcript_37508/g.110813  ORF Transcript_37508/g.110813 Transcript_37508/m.110813 type:complete len:182 (+) Transcript_37508:484-1029(+)